MTYQQRKNADQLHRERNGSRANSSCSYEAIMEAMKDHKTVDDVLKYFQKSHLSVRPVLSKDITEEYFIEHTLEDGIVLKPTSDREETHLLLWKGSHGYLTTITFKNEDHRSLEERTRVIRERFQHRPEY